MLKQENKDLRYGAMERKKRKKDNKTVLSTAAVLTTDAMKAIVAAREAVEEAKRNTKEQRKRSKIKREEAVILYKEQVKARKEARAAASEAKRKTEQHQRQFRAALLASKKAQKALETASRIATKKKTAEAQEEFRKVEDQAASGKALATTAQLTVEASTVIFEAATAHSKALIAAVKKVAEVNTQVEVDDNEQSNLSDSEVSDEDVDMDVGMDIGNAVQSIE